MYRDEEEAARARADALDRELEETRARLAERERELDAAQRERARLAAELERERAAHSSPPTPPVTPRAPYSGSGTRAGWVFLMVILMFVVSMARACVRTHYLR
jgi:hypothetical protein